MSEPEARPTTAPDQAVRVAGLVILTLLVCHLAGDVHYGYEPANLSSVIAVSIASLWLYAVYALAGRRAGYALLLLGALFSLMVPVIHMSGKGVRDEVVRSSGGAFFIGTMLALSMTAAFSSLLSVHGLFRVRTSVLSFILWTAAVLALAGVPIGYFLFGAR